jgi:uncharacterized ion transporter superfamily protein YfcC
MGYSEKEYPDAEAIDKTFARLEVEQINQHNKKLQRTKGSIIFLLVLMVVVDFLVAFAMFSSGKTILGWIVVGIAAIFIPLQIKLNVIPRLKEKPMSYPQV